MSKFALCTISLLFGLVSYPSQGLISNVAQHPKEAVPFNKEGLQRTIDKLAMDIMANEHIPGASVVVVKDGHTIIKTGYGVADIETDRPVDPDKTIFRIGSVSKVLTAWALTRLADQSKVSLEDDVADYFEGFQNITNISGSSQPVRLRNLITHTSGFDQIGRDRHIWELDRTLDERISMRPNLTSFLNANNLRRISPPGAYYRYDTYGITLAGAVVEKVTGLPYADAMQKVLFEPAGMKNTYVGLAPKSREHLAKGHGYIDDKLLTVPYEVYVTQPASSIDATTADMGLLLEALTNDGVNSHGRLFSEEQTKKMLAPQYRPHPDFPGVTHGMNEHSRASDSDSLLFRSLNHGGSILGFRSNLSVFPELRLAVFIVVNRNAEAGGTQPTLDSKVKAAVFNAYYSGDKTNLYHVPAKNLNASLDEYAGNYYYGVFCHTCGTKRFPGEGWPKSEPNRIQVSAGSLKIIDILYHQTSDKDVFVSSNGKQKVHFKRDNNRRITSFSWDSSPDVMERLDKSSK